MQFNDSVVYRLVLKYLSTYEAEIQNQYTPDLITFMLGTNDAAKSGSSNDVPLATYKSNMLQIIQRYQKVAPKAKWILMTPPPTADNQQSTRSNTDLQSYGNAVKDIGKQLNLPVLDLYSAVQSNFQSNSSSKANFYTDGIHFSYWGNVFVYNQISSMITKTYPEWNPSTIQWQIPDISKA